MFAPVLGCQGGRCVSRKCSLHLLEHRRCSSVTRKKLASHLFRPLRSQPFRGTRDHSPHLDGLNLSRPWMLEAIASALPNRDLRLASMRATAAPASPPSLASITKSGTGWEVTRCIWLREEGFRNSLRPALLRLEEKRVYPPAPKVDCPLAASGQNYAVIQQPARNVRQSYRHLAVGELTRTGTTKSAIWLPRGRLE